MFVGFVLKLNSIINSIRYFFVWKLRQKLPTVSFLVSFFYKYGECINMKSNDKHDSLWCIIWLITSLCYLKDTKIGIARFLWLSYTRHEMIFICDDFSIWLNWFRLFEMPFAMKFRCEIIRKQKKLYDVIFFSFVLNTRKVVRRRKIADSSDIWHCFGLGLNNLSINFSFLVSILLVYVIFFSAVFKVHPIT